MKRNATFHNSIYLDIEECKDLKYKLGDEFLVKDSYLNHLYWEKEFADFIKNNPTRVAIRSIAKDKEKDKIWYELEFTLPFKESGWLVTEETLDEYFFKIADDVNRFLDMELQ